MGAGKTTAIDALSDNGVVSTDVENTDKESHSKLLTTVGIDYGNILIPPDTKVGLYGTPGQERFELVWRIVTEGALGAIILIDSTSPKAAKELPFYLDYFASKNMDHIVVGLTHADEHDKSHLELKDCFEILETKDYVYPIFDVDARERDDIFFLIETLLTSIEASL